MGAKEAVVAYKTEYVDLCSAAFHAGGSRPPHDEDFLLEEEAKQIWRKTCTWLEADGAISALLDARKTCDPAAFNRAVSRLDPLARRLGAIARSETPAVLGANRFVQP